MKIPFKLSEDTFDKKEVNAVKNILNNNEKLTYGRYVKKLEKKIALLNNRKYCVMTNSGSSANLIGVASIFYSQKFDLKMGDEVIVPSLSWSTTYSPLIQFNLKLVFVDININSLNLDEDLIEKSISKKTKAIFAVNILGKSNNFHKLRKICKKYNLILMVDNCESFLSKYRNQVSAKYGVFSTLSSFFSHHFSTIEGGYFLTDDFNIYCTALSLRSHGWIREQPKNSKLIKKKYSNFERSYKFVLPGYNLRPTEINAVIGLEQVKKVKKFIKNRKKNAKYFYELFKDCKNVNIIEYDNESSHFAFVIILKKNIRNKIINLLSKKGIETRPVVSGNILNNEMLKYSKYRIGSKIENVKIIEKKGIMIGNRSNIFNNIDREALIYIKKTIETS